MKDISQKIKTLRIATARATLKVDPSVIKLIHENKIPKGNPLEVAKVAAIQAAKNTYNVIPYCHQIPIDFIEVNFEIKESSIEITVEVKSLYKTGVEMEALTGASIAALTLYDMMKMLDDRMEIETVKLINKQGGKSNFQQHFKSSPKAAVLVMSDSIASGKKDDLSGQMIVSRLKDESVQVVEYKIITDDKKIIQEHLKNYADEMKLDIVVTTGGTGFSPRDITPEAMKEIIEREIPGIPEVIRAYGQERTPYSMLSRGKAGIRGKTLIINLPGSKKGVSDSLDVLFPSVLHSLKMIQGFGHDIQKKEKMEV